MPYVDGLAVCRHLHTLAPDVPIVFVTALDRVHEHAAAAGADGVLAKPFEPEEPLAALHVRHSGEERPAQVAGMSLRVDPDAVGAGLRLE